MEDLINKLIKELLDFENATISKIDNFNFDIPQNVNQVIVEEKTNPVPFYVMGGVSVLTGLFLGGKSALLFYTLGAGVLAYPIIKGKSTKEQEPNNLVKSKWDSVEFMDKMSDVLTFSDDFDNLLIKNRKSIQAILETSISDDEKRKKVDRLSFYKAVPDITQITYSSDIIKAFDKEDASEVNRIKEQFKSDCKKALKNSVNEQKEKYLKMKQIISE